METLPTDCFASRFLESSRPHILMITNHGIHDWQILPGLLDTGGQNIFVNDMTSSLTSIGFRVTIVNRGGFPHPETGILRDGLDYHDENKRILYIGDGHPHPVRKEDMNNYIPILADYLTGFFNREKEKLPDGIISHYWDGALLGQLFNDSVRQKLPHVWIPHSLGHIKKGNLPHSNWKELRIDERIRLEEQILESIDAVGSTSMLINSCLRSEYGYTGLISDIPPGVDIERFTPGGVPADDAVWDYLCSRCKEAPASVKSGRFIIEISRTDKTKRKDLLVESFSKLAGDHEDLFLLVAVSEDKNPVAQQLRNQIRTTAFSSRIITIGAVPELVSSLYAVSSIYATPSVMEGFGMSVQEAASSGIPAVASSHVPFVNDFLLGDSPESVSTNDTGDTFLAGKAALVVPSENADLFAAALGYLLDNEELLNKMGQSARSIAEKGFAWDSLIRNFLMNIGWSLP